jgi:hypothetical protein
MLRVSRELSGALKRARIPILTIAATYFLSLVIGIAAVHSGSSLALAQRDQIVGKAIKGDPASLAMKNGHHVRAALFDFSRNLFLGAIPSTAGGLGVFIPYPVAALRGWVGGIVSVNSAHTSRLSTGKSAAYYLIVLLLQLTPYSLAGGAGVYLGREWYRARTTGTKRYWWAMPRQAVFDVVWIYSLIVPLFLVASLVEFCW